MTLRLRLFMLMFAVLVAGAFNLSAKEHRAPENQPTPERPVKDPNRVADRALAGESQQAAGEGHEGGEHDQFKYSPIVRKLAQLLHADYKLAYWIFVLLNFAIIFGAILWIAKSRVPAAFRSRTASIQKGMEEARRASEDANRRLADVEARLQRLDTEIAAMKTQAESDAQAEEVRIRAAAEQDGRKIVELAEQEITASGNAARRELKAYAAELAVSIAEKKIHLDAKSDEALVRSFVSELGRDGQ